MNPGFATRNWAHQKKSSTYPPWCLLPFIHLQHTHLSAKADRFEHLPHKRNNNKKETGNTRPSTQLWGLRLHLISPRPVTGKVPGMNQTCFHTQLHARIPQDSEVFWVFWMSAAYFRALNHLYELPTLPLTMLFSASFTQVSSYLLPPGFKQTPF